MTCRATETANQINSILLYVSPTGNDAWSGTCADATADGTDGPFATIARARDAVRAMKQRQPLAAPVRVLLRGGSYTLNETLIFTPADSGTADCPITYAAIPGEAVVISGGQAIGHWMLEEVNGQTRWRTHLPAVATEGWYFHQLFVQGERRQRPRLPREGYYRFAGFRDEDQELPWGVGPEAVYFAPGEIQAWVNPDDIDIISLQYWLETHLHIASLDLDHSLVTFTANSRRSLRDETGQFARYYLDNVFEALDTPGQWYLDRPSGTLYYLPLPGEDPATLEVIAPRLECLVHFHGSETEPVRHIRLENLAFRHAEWTLPPDDPGAWQASSNVPGAIMLEGAESCVLYGCEVSCIGQHAIEVLHGSRHNRIVGCALFNLGGGGVKINHEGKSVEQLEEEPPGLRFGAPETFPGMHTTVSDCTIHDGGLIFHGAVGIWIGNSGHNRIHHNEVYNFFYTGISCGWTWGYMSTLTVDNRIEYNHIHDIGFKLLSDMGGIYLLGPQPGTMVRGNVIHDITKYGYGGFGIYLDEGSSGVVVEDNLTYRTHSASFFQHFGQDNLLRNNIFALGTEGHLGCLRVEDHRSLTAVGNILYAEQGPLFQDQYEGGRFRLRGNFYWHTRGTGAAFKGASLADWQARGWDTGGRWLNPLFSHPAAGDFTLREDSPVLALGFRPLDPASAGPRFRKTRPPCVDAVPADEEIPATIVSTHLSVAESILPGGEPGTVRLTVTNQGETPSGGHITLMLWPPAAGVLDPASIAYALQPGEEASYLVRVSVPPEAARLEIETLPEGEGTVPTCLYLEFGLDNT